MPPPSVSGHMPSASLRCFNESSPTTTQPAPDKNVFAIHLGGSKRVTRWQGGTHQSWNVQLHAITLMPAYRANRWHTDGVIAFANLTFGAALLKRLAREEFDRDPSELVFLDKVGLVDPLLSELMLALSREFSVPRLRRMYCESLLTTLGITLLKRYTSLFKSNCGSKLAQNNYSAGLTGWQMRKVTEHLASNALRDISVDELVQITGLSRAQFFRAFDRSTGHTPAHCVQQLRMGRAATLLEEGRSITEVA